MKTLEKRRKRFEDFVPIDGTVDIFEKINALDAFLKEFPPEFVNGLGIPILGPASKNVMVTEADGYLHDVIMLGSNSYFSLTTHPRVVKASHDALKKYGYGMGAVSLYAGTTDLHKQLEQQIAEFYHAEDAMIFPCGYSGNVGVISALCGKGDVVINDVANHVSIFDGCLLTKADIKIYLHRNMKHLERVLERLPGSQRGRLIITEGVFSMDGDLAPLDEIVNLANRYKTRIMIDDAHALGVIGKTGRGTPEKFNCMDKIDIIYGTLSKTPGAIGGYCVGSKSLIQYLRFYARTYMFSTSLPAPVIAGLIEVFRILEEDTSERKKLWANIEYMLKGLRGLGFNVGNTESAIIPIIIGDESILGRFHNELRRQGVFTNIVTYPAVRRKECRIRVSMMSTLTRGEMDRALSLIGKLGRKYGIIT